MSATGAPTPTPAQLTSTSRRPKRSPCAATTRATSSSSAMLPATASTSKPAVRSSRAATSSLSGRRAATVRAWPSSPRTWAMARPMPEEAPVTSAARADMAGIQPNPRVGCGRPLGQRPERGHTLAERALLVLVDPRPARPGGHDESRLAVIVDLVHVDGPGAAVLGEPPRARTPSRRERDVARGEQQQRDPRLFADARQGSAIAPQVDEDPPVAGAHRGRDRDRERASVQRGEHGHDAAGPLGKRVERRMPAHRNHREIRTLRNGITTLTISTTSVPLMTRARSVGDMALSWWLNTLSSEVTTANAISQAASVVARRAVHRREREASMARTVRRQPR